MPETVLEGPSSLAKRQMAEADFDADGRRGPEKAARLLSAVEVLLAPKHIAVGLRVVLARRHVAVGLGPSALALAAVLETVGAEHVAAAQALAEEGKAGELAVVLWLELDKCLAGCEGG